MEGEGGGEEGADAERARASKRAKLVQEIETLKKKLNIVGQDKKRTNNKEPSTPTSRKILLIFDINKVLIHRHDTMYNPTRFTERPHVIEFLEHFADIFQLAVWTTMTPRVGKDIVSSLFPQALAERFLFVWYQSQCKVAPNLNGNLKFNDQDLPL